MGWRWAMTHGFDQSAYGLAYEFDVDGDMTAEAVYVKLNIEPPEDYRARSMSMSDIVVFLREDGCRAMYCDTIGFVELDHDFWEEAL